MKLIKNLLSFVILLFVVLNCKQMTEEERLKYEERKKVVEILNDRFDLSKADRTVYETAKGIKYDCSFKFRVEYEKDKVLIGRFCESTSSYTREKEKLDAVLTSENLTLIKNSGFEKVELYDRFEGKLIDQKQIQ